jgi:hypothetical protein
VVLEHLRPDLHRRPGALGARLLHPGDRLPRRARAMRATSGRRTCTTTASSPWPSP